MMGDENVSDKIGFDNEEIVEELKSCLPKWVTQEQVTDMIRGTWRNMIEIVDDFYEHETKFYEQVSAFISFTSRDGISSSNHDEFVSKLEFIRCETEQNESRSSSSQFHKLKSSISPVKRNRKMKGKPKKKGKAAAGPKQASITKFFNKVPSSETNA